MQARLRSKLQARLEALPGIARDIARTGQLRMCQRHLMAAGKAKVVAITAIASEVVGCVRTIARAATAVHTRATPEDRCAASTSHRVRSSAIGAMCD